MKRLLTAVGLLVTFAIPASAQPLKLQIANGRVTLDAVNVSARQILAEWARIGGTKVVGADTLKLVDMPERQALDIILRNVAGFMAAPRAAAAAAGASTYDRILVMATSAGAAQAASTSPGRPGTNVVNGAMNGTQRRVPAARPPSPADGDDADDEAESGTVSDQSERMNQPVFTFPGPGAQAPGMGQPVFNPIQGGQMGQQFQPQGGYPPTGPASGLTNPGYQNGQTPVINLQPPGGSTVYTFSPTGAAPGVAPPPSTTFGIVGAPTPGMIQQPVAPGQPVPPQRPPR
jgi:hypothetical protein